MSKNKYFPKVKLFGKKQIERWAGSHFLCIDARLHLLYCISWPNYYTLLHTEMQNADKMHLFCCHSQQPDSCKSCDFHFITIRSLAHGLGNAGFLAERIFRHSQVFRLLHRLGFYHSDLHQLEHLHRLLFVITILVIAIACKTSSALSAPSSSSTSILSRTRRRFCAGKNYWHDWINPSFPQMVNDHWWFINRKRRDKITYCEDHWNGQTLYGILQF